MRDAFLLTDSEELAREFEQSLVEFGFKYIRDYNCYVIGNESSYLEVERQDSIVQYYEEDDYRKLDNLGVNVHGLCVYAIGYRRPTTLLHWLKTLRSFERLWFDNAHRLILPVDALVDGAEAAPWWDWDIDEGATN